MNKLILILASVMLTAAAVFADSVSLAWDASSSTNVVAYRMYMAQGSGAYNFHASTTGLTLTVSNLLSGASYRFYVTAQNSALVESDPSNTLIYSTPGNQAPTISAIPPYTTGTNIPVTVNFTVGDSDTPLANLALTAASSNASLLPTNRIAFSGSGASRSAVLNPTIGQSGASTVTITVSDGTNTASSVFTLSVTLPSSLVVVSNTAPIVVTTAGGAASPYPSTISVAGTSGTITNLTLTLLGLGHTFPSDLDILLVGPGGQKVMVLSDVGEGIDVSGLTITLSDGATAFLPAVGALTSGTFKPTDVLPGEARDTFPAPAPAMPYASTLATFNGLSANGTWSLYVQADGPADSGAISGGWRLSLATAGATNPPLNTAPTISNIPNLTNGWNKATAQLPFTISDAESAPGLLTLTKATSNTNIVLASGIVFGGSGANRTVRVTPVNNALGTVTITVTVSDGFMSASDVFNLTVVGPPSKPKNLKLEE